MSSFSDEEFDQIITEALNELPDQVRAALENIAIFVADEYEPLPQEAEAFAGKNPPEVFGMYDGIPLTERGDDPFLMPDQITIFKNPLERHFTEREELREQIRVTVIHEVAHYFGIDDERLHELGWG